MNENRKSNCKKILEFLQNNRYITVKIAREKIHVDYCSQRIYDLKKYFGVTIHSFTVTTRNQEKFAIYKLAAKS